MGRYQYELSRCVETGHYYNIPNVSGNTFVNARSYHNYDTICLKDVTATGTDWRTATGFIHWGLRYNGGSYLHPYERNRVYCDCFGKDRLIINNFPTDRIVIVGVYGFQWYECNYSSTDCCSGLSPVAQRQMFILPSGQGACFSMYCAIENLCYYPDGRCIYPGWCQSINVSAFPYFFSVESYPLPVLNSNGFIGNYGCDTYVRPTAICSTGSANADSHTIPIYCNNQYIDCNPSCFVDPWDSCLSPAIKGSAAGPWSLGGKLSADSNSSARDAYVLVSSCGGWTGECGVPDNLAMVIANNTFPTGGCRWYGPMQTPTWNKLAYAFGMIECCYVWSDFDGGNFQCPIYGPYGAARANCSDYYCVPNINEDSLIWFNIPPTSDNLTAHMTDSSMRTDPSKYYSCMCAYSTACFAHGGHLVCNPLGYWTLNWNNGNSYYAVNTHC